MKRFERYDFDLSWNILSVFDIGGTMQEKNGSSLSNGLDYDMEQLFSDQTLLFKDYRKACERLSLELDELLKNKKKT